MNNKVIILTGEIQTGKTTLLQQFCRQRNDVAGILTPVVNGKRVFYDIAGKNSFSMEASGDEDSIPIGKYVFSVAAFAKANNILLSAVAHNDCKYLIIDEIGPLEIKQQKGLYQSLNKIPGSSFNYNLIIVVRQSLVDEALKTFALGNAEVLTLASMKKRFESRC